MATAQEQQKKPPVFVGYCEPGEDPADGTCVLDEPEGQNPDTYGTVTYDRTVTAETDTLTFVPALDIDPAALRGPIRTVLLDAIASLG